ncbi:conserved hypothetical protein [Verticillium alfalfae VaMs.102]|uniref:Mmc1 C-terminal domain-containing protein n=1 Tax=Verticillium alfalfae (strain VaMs.102 / ATCC MYA-4576 / FGSC 10136) TaxID=526221 RepID=C9SNY2_VERA1|nr:conserved hypothetical protein [Verticillium alfalfae VaMs.102]EEY20497.1 conserved hypothetical protein [Verticillium alfalfae VaMs.102]
MTSRIPLRAIAGRSVASPLRPRSSLARTPACLFCALITRTPRRFQSTTSAAPSNPRAELIDALLDLQKHAPNYINLSRLQLALQGLRQPAGEESIRVAILGLADGAEPGTTARDLLRLLLADPLASEQAWEKQMATHDARQPLVVRIRQAQPRPEAASLTIAKTNLLHELEVSRPGLNGLHIELLLTEVSPLAGGVAGELGAVDAEEAVLVPTVDIPSNTGRYNPITTPVHKALVVTRGLMGAAAVATLPVLQNRHAVLAAVDLPGFTATRPPDESTTFQPIDVAAAGKGVDLFRENIGHAMEYERLWNGSNIPALVAWLKTGAEAQDGVTKTALRQLITSLLNNTTTAIAEEESRQLRGRLSDNTTAASSPESAALNSGLAAWSQEAHEELQKQLDLAFAGRRWRKLGWWKLFWRVDDVGYLTSEILSQRFLPSAERELVYLAGRIEQAGTAHTAGAPMYTQPLPASEQPPVAAAPAPTTVTRPTPKWPTHIAFTRRYLHAETVPALQALAQKLVLQASSTAGLATSLAALLFMSSSVTTLYEAGAVAALGIVWRLRRLQTKWETAREFWEGDVREEGRKAVRGAEASIAGVLEGKTGSPTQAHEDVRERELARQLTEKAADALSRMK